MIEDAHSIEEARFESRIGELEWDLGKTASSLLKAKEAKASKSLELRRLKRKVKSGEGSMVCAIGEAKEAMRAEFQIRLSKIADYLDSLAAVHVRDLAWRESREGRTRSVKCLSLREPKRPRFPSVELSRWMRKETST